MELSLPRLLYVGDVPIASTVGGSILIYRLLQQYPASQLQIVEGNIAVSEPDKRLIGVDYHVLNVGSQRLLHSRLTPLYSAYLLVTARQRATQLIKLSQKFQPEAILTVSHGFSWLTAAALAKRLDLPLHLIVHDDVIALTPVPRWYRQRFDRQLQRVYRQARSRMCVSPYMRDAYHRRYSVVGSVLYPSRARDLTQFDSPPERVLHRTGDRQLKSTLKFAYAGSIHTPGQARALVELAKVLQEFSSQLWIYSALTTDDANRLGLNLPNIIIHSLIESNKLVRTLRQSVDVLFAPMDFDPRNLTSVELCFPSKLTDYTATGLPLLIWGRYSCSAVRWARDNPNVAAVVETEDTTALTVKVKEIHANWEYCKQLGINALKTGQKYFGYDRILSQFYWSIQQPKSVQPN